MEHERSPRLGPEILQLSAPPLTVVMSSSSSSPETLGELSTSASSLSEPTSLPYDTQDLSLKSQALFWLIAEVKTGMFSTAETLAETAQISEEVQASISKLAGREKDLPFCEYISKRWDEIIRQMIDDIMLLLPDALIKEKLLLIKLPIANENDVDDLKQKIKDVKNFLFNKIMTLKEKIFIRISCYSHDFYEDSQRELYQAALYAESILNKLSIYDLSILKLIDLKKIYGELLSANSKINLAEARKNQEAIEIAKFQKEKAKEVVQNIIVYAIRDCLRTEIYHLYMAAYTENFDDMLYLFFSLQYKVDCLINLSAFIFSDQNIPIEKNRTSILLILGFLDMFKLTNELKKLAAVKHIIDRFLQHTNAQLTEHECSGASNIITLCSIFQDQYIAQFGDDAIIVKHTLDFSIVYHTVLEKYYNQLGRVYDNTFIHEEKINIFLYVIVNAIKKLSHEGFENILSAECFHKFLSKKTDFQQAFDVVLAREEQVFFRSFLKIFLPFIMKLLALEQTCDPLIGESVMRHSQFPHTLEDISRMASTTSLADLTDSVASSSSDKLRPHSDMLAPSRLTRSGDLKKHHSTSSLPHGWIPPCEHDSLQAKHSMTSYGHRPSQKKSGVGLATSSFFQSLGRSLSDFGSQLPDVLGAVGQVAQRCEILPLGSSVSSPSLFGSTTSTDTFHSSASPRPPFTRSQSSLPLVPVSTPISLVSSAASRSDTAPPPSRRHG